MWWLARFAQSPPRGLSPYGQHLLDTRVDAAFNVTWDWDGHPCRCRCDEATEDAWCDLKTTSDETPLKTFWRSVLIFQYDLQAAVYESAAEAGSERPCFEVFEITDSSRLNDLRRA